MTSDDFHNTKDNFLGEFAKLFDSNAKNGKIRLTFKRGLFIRQFSRNHKIYQENRTPDKVK